jgi:hypothetical protein
MTTIVSEVPGEEPVEFEAVAMLAYQVHSKLLNTIQGEFAASGIRNSGAKVILFALSLDGVIEAFERSNPDINLREMLAGADMEDEPIH